MPYVNFTTHAHEENKKILSLERHIDIFNTAQCTRSSVQLSFDDEHYREAQNAWSWVNQDTLNYIILVTDNDDCNVPDGDPGSRQPWHVTEIHFDDGLNLVTFAAQPITFEEAFSDWRLQGGSKTLVTNPIHSSYGRNLNKRFKIAGKPKINLASDFSKIGVNLKDTKAGSLRIECNPCYSKGSLDFNIDVVPWALPLPPHLDGFLEVKANEISAAAAAKFIAAAKFDGKDFESTLFSFPIPDAGITIPGIAELGFILKFKIKGNVGKIEGEVTASAGVKVEIPKDSTYRIDFKDSKKNINKGWTPIVTPILEISADVTVSSEVGPELSIEAAAKIVGLGGVIGLALAGPTVEAKAHLAATTNGGVCNNPKALAGVDFAINIKADLHAFESANLGVVHPAATQTIFGTSWPVFSTCLTIPGKTKTSSTIPPSTPATPTPTPPPFPITNGTTTQV